MTKYDDLAARYGVELAGFTEGYLRLFEDGLKLLESFIRENPDVLVVYVMDIERWRGKDRQTTLKIEV